MRIFRIAHVPFWNIWGNDDTQRYTTKYYNLDAILSVGYRVNSRNATLFRQWAKGQRWVLKRGVDTIKA